MNAQALFRNLETRGFCLFREGDRLVIEPADGLTPRDVAALTAHKPALLALIGCCELKWRIDAMRGQLPIDRLFPIPSLVARPDLAPAYQRGRCFSCGELRADRATFGRCDDCGRAMRIVLGVEPEPPLPWQAVESDDSTKGGDVDVGE